MPGGAPGEAIDTIAGLLKIDPKAEIILISTLNFTNVKTAIEALEKGAAEFLAAAGGTIIAQDEKTSVVWGMPQAVAIAGICSAILPLDDISVFLNKLTAS